MGPPCLFGQRRRRSMVGQKRNLAQSSPRKAAQVAERKVATLKRRRAGLSGAMLEGFVLRARRVVGLKGTVNVLVMGSSEMRVLNRRFGGKDKPTDVLSFPALAQIEGGKFAGDVAVCKLRRELGLPTGLIERNKQAGTKGLPVRKTRASSRGAAGSRRPR